jgi:cysteinyl-tRNA synthetase
MENLGKTFDIHTGGIDHIPVHHNNEIAQSEAATGVPFVNYWIHHAHVIINSEKMAKSAGNFLKLSDLIEKGIDPLAYRFWLLGGHYRTQMNYTDEAIAAADTGLKKLRAAFLALGETNGSFSEKYVKDFANFMFDDLDTPKALALLWTLIKDQTVEPGDKRATLLEFDKILGLGLSSLIIEEVPQKIILLAEAREQARKNKDYQKSDELRKEIEAQGYTLKDTELGPQISKK